ncbi:MAG: hypothetical protein WCJ72_19390 [Chryseobacterium sp.]|jgi:hypothetical protein
MAENKDSNPRELEKLALIAESVQTMFSGKGTIIFELPIGEYNSVINHFREIDRQHKQFTIDISGTEFHFILMEDKS